MKKYYLPGAAFVALVIAVLGGAVALGAFDGDDDNGGGQTVSEGDAARCAEGATDCDDTSGDDDIFGICLSEDDPAYNPDEPCEDTVDGDGTGLGMCAPGVTDCDDMIVDGGEDVSQICLAGAEDCNDTPGGGECGPDNTAACEGRAIEIAFADLEQRLPGTEIAYISTEYTEWSDSSLGNPREGESYAQVITPGFKIVLEAGGTQYEYHTDLTGNFALLD
jgi:hypothetical protein